jgi:hypothetical protein
MTNQQALIFNRLREFPWSRGSTPSRKFHVPGGSEWPCHEAPTRSTFSIRFEFLIGLLCAAISFPTANGSKAACELPQKRLHHMYGWSGEKDLKAKTVVYHLYGKYNSNVANCPRRWPQLRRSLASGTIPHQPGRSSLSLAIVQDFASARNQRLNFPRPGFAPGS